MGALSRRKGAVYEREITKELRKLFGPAVKRGIGQERSGGEIADVTGVPFFWVQTKHGRFVSIRDALRQSENELLESKKTGLWPVAIVKFDREDDIVSMRLSQFIELLLVWDHRERLHHEPDE